LIEVRDIVKCMHSLIILQSIGMFTQFKVNNVNSMCTFLVRISNLHVSDKEELCYVIYIEHLILGYVNQV